MFATERHTYRFLPTMGTHSTIPFVRGSIANPEQMAWYPWLGSYRSSCDFRHLLPLLSALIICQLEFVVRMRRQAGNAASWSYLKGSSDHTASSLLSKIETLLAVTT